MTITVAERDERARSAFRRLRGRHDGHISGLPNLCALGNAGRWLTVQASLAGPGLHRLAKTMVVISPTGPKEVACLRKSIYGLSPRQEVNGLVFVRGFSTKEISKRSRHSPV